MPLVRICESCGQKNRVPAKHLAATGRCGACKSPLPPVNEPWKSIPSSSTKSRKPPASLYWSISGRPGVDPARCPRRRWPARRRISRAAPS